MGSAGGKKLADKAAPGERVPGLEVALAIFEKECGAGEPAPRPARGGLVLDDQVRDRQWAAIEPAGSDWLACRNAQPGRLVILGG